MGSLGMGELVVILLIMLLVFGASRLPQLGESLGKAVKGLKRGLAADDDIDVTKRVPDKTTTETASRDVAEAEVVRKS
ncbi:MAG: twin-arginine translocase TatA/TatE family subunit [Sandaracinus sp.]